LIPLRPGVPHHIVWWNFATPFAQRIETRLQRLFGFTGFFTAFGAEVESSV
jgi:hypothetical protein